MFLSLNKQYMKEIGLIACVALLAVACNNAGNSTKTTDGTSVKDKTNMYDTGIGSSAPDSNRHDTSLIPNKMQDTGMKK
jgi:hypothetical protein